MYNSPSSFHRVMLFYPAMIYSADLTGGPLFTEEFDNLFEKMSIEEALASNWDNSVLLINSEAAKKRVAQEIRKRLATESRLPFWEGYQQKIPHEKPLLLLYVCAKTYHILFDFLHLVVFEKLKTYQYQLRKEEFRFFIERKRSDHPELDQWTESTLTKVTNVIFLMFRQSGILREDQLKLPEVSYQLISLFSELDEKWFLELLMVPQDKFKDISNGNE